MRRNSLTFLILAAGKGVRLKSKQAKVLHQINGLPMLAYLLEATAKLPVREKVLIVGHQSEEIEACFKRYGLLFVKQEEQLGTGQAVLRAEGLLRDRGGDILVIPGDLPLIEPGILQRFIEFHHHHGEQVSVLSTEFEHPQGYGRIVRDELDNVDRIVEEVDAAPQESQIREVNTGIFCLRNDRFLWSSLKEIGNDNAQGEYYLTDIVQIYKGEGGQVKAMIAEESQSLLGVNSRAEMARAGEILRQRKLDRLMADGVTIVDRSTILIDEQVNIGTDTVIFPFTGILGRSEIAEDCAIGPHSVLRNSVIEKDSIVEYSVIEGAKVGEQGRIGPFSYICTKLEQD